MPQMHFSISEALADDVRAAAQTEDKGISRYLADLVAKSVAPKSGWPTCFFERVVGGWQGSTLVREDQGQVETRDSL